MARIRIVDEWLRSPVASPSRIRAVMVVAESWAEQRVLMRAYAAAPDQTRPTILLHGVELAIGPAGPEPHGPWGIHVAPPADGRAQELRGHLELAARRLAGSKGNPPRLVDEAPRFDEGPTGQWAPGTPPAPPGSRTRLGRDYYEPALAAPPAPGFVEVGRATVVANPSLADAPVAATPSPAFDGARTVAGFATATAAGTPPPTADGQLARLVGKTMPLGFRLDAGERAVLDALGKSHSLTARDIGALLGVADPVAWMDGFIYKLGTHGLDLVAPAVAAAEPTYALRR